ncbi:glycoside hydrolase 43 family protein [Akkermansia sp. N21116]|jgi:beta-xylosidase|uniref:glycoside hydrolase family 43 protein n=1 Tax=Akkermansia sp. N21116 TaxID=3040764 RepID=UPI00244EA0B7|nr:glycoside hydrolase 43 family protein [Akkermansia sp. N21116]WPX41032.1 glycoside hydrolase 43 family protein [Akkermansia sp. N21116]
MKKLCTISLLCLLFPAPLYAWTPDNGNGTFTNPLMWGDWPDPDVIRVGDDFYMVSTSMHYVPGSPIATSRDLVNWKMIGYAIDRYDEDPRYDLKGGSLYLNGSWANSIRYNKGKFYVAFCTPYGRGIEKGHFSVCEADKPEGPWKRTIFPEYLYDPGLFFDDDGKVYVVHGQHDLYITELNSDVKSVKGENVKIWDKGFKDSKTLGGGFGMEGSHMYKINGKYYITCPAGGTGGWQICLRSDNIYGPYEHKLIMDDDSSYPGNGLHQGGMVQLKNGDWWFIIMQDRGAIGRVPYLVPVTWVDGWPMLGANGKDAITYPKPAVGKTFPVSSPATTDEFNAPKLGLQWQWNHNPDNTKWSLTEKSGFMRLKALPARDLKDARNTLTQRVQGPNSEGTVEMDVSGLKDGNVAGFGIFQFPYAYVAVTQDGNTRKIVMCNNGAIIETPVEKFTGNKLWIRARAMDKDFTARFYYSTDGQHFIPIGNTLKMGLGLPWTANRFALFNFTTKDEGKDGHVDFNWFRFTDK